MNISRFFQNSRTLNQQMLELTVQLANINSGTYNPTGIAKIATLLRMAFLKLGCKSELLKLPMQSKIDNFGNPFKFRLGPLLRLYKRPNALFKVLLVGHMDTVFGINHKFQRVKKVSNNKIKGPGVCDMKGGIVVMLEALRAFEQMPFADKLGWEVLLTPDEEIGSIGTKPILIESARRCQIGLLYEPAFTEQGVLAGNRKGGGDFTLIARGKTAHAGKDFDKGRNSICAMALLINAINDLNNKQDGVTINIGNIHGGEAANVVPNTCVARMDVRIPFIRDGNWLTVKFNQLIKEVEQQTGVDIELHGSFFKKPKYITGKTARLYELVKAIGKEISQEISWEPSGGCCDGNNLSEAGLPNVDSLGVRGGGIHSEDEYLIIDSLVERAILSGSILSHLAQFGFE